jgi:hypothetical protein
MVVLNQRGKMREDTAVDKGISVGGIPNQNEARLQRGDCYVQDIRSFIRRSNKILMNMANNLVAGMSDLRHLTKQTRSSRLRRAHLTDSFSRMTLRISRADAAVLGLAS